jgi:signal transduction histidine kinase
MRILISICTLFVIIFLTSNSIFSQPTDSTRTVVIENIFVSGVKVPEGIYKITASEKDSITINYKLKAAGGAPQSAFLFQTVFKNGVDSSVKTIGVTTVIFKNLKDDKYVLRISAFDLQRKWNAIPVELTIEVDNEKKELMKVQDSLNNRIKTILDLVKNSPAGGAESQAATDKPFSLINIVLAGLLIIFIIAFVFTYLKLSKIKSLSTKTSSSGEQKFDYSLIKNMVNKSDYELLQLENSRQRAEVASLRGQIDAMSVRSSQLSNQNRDLQTSLTKLSKHKVELEELQQQKDDLFAVIIHDIKNPAALIKSLVELLTSYDLSATEQQEIITDIANTTIKIVALSQEVSRILSLESNKMMLNFEKCDINQVVQDVFHRNHIHAKNKSINMFNELDNTLPDTEIDPQRIDEVIDNLLSNAIKFTPTGGTIRVKTFKQQNELVFEVSDNGLGLTEDDLKHAFQRGARLSAKPTQGESTTGLGLWIVKKLLDAHHGKVWVKSTIGKGSTFSFSVPIKQPVSEE